MGFERNENDELTVDGLLLSDIGDKFGTPLYVYSAKSIIESYNNFKAAIAGVNGQIHFAVKANSNLAILRLLADLGSGADIVSIGEMHRALRAGIAPEKIIFSGVGKTDADIREAIELGVGQINAESEAEIDAIVRVSDEMKKGCRVALRVNPDVEAKTHEKMATGSDDTKFGIPPDSSITRLYNRISTSRYLKEGGLAVHIGSQIMDFDAYEESWLRLKHIAKGFQKLGYKVPSFDLGGGFGIDYATGKTINLDDFSSLLQKHFGDESFALGFEPGRFLVAEAGALLTKIIYIKSNFFIKSFVIVDGAMNDLIRPTLYDAYHRIEAVKPPSENTFTADIVGPICETGDYLGLDRRLPFVESGDYLAVLSAGAYGAVMRSSYNTRPPAAEVLVLDGEAHRISKPITIDDLLNQDIIPDALAQGEKT